MATGRKTSTPGALKKYSWGTFSTKSKFRFWTKWAHKLERMVTKIEKGGWSQNGHRSGKSIPRAFFPIPPLNVQGWDWGKCSRSTFGPTCGHFGSSLLFLILVPIISNLCAQIFAKSKFGLFRKSAPRVLFPTRGHFGSSPLFPFVCTIFTICVPIFSDNKNKNSKNHKTTRNSKNNKNNKKRHQQQ